MTSIARSTRRQTMATKTEMKTGATQAAILDAAKAKLESLGVECGAERFDRLHRWLLTPGRDAVRGWGRYETIDQILNRWPSDADEASKRGLAVEVRGLFSSIPSDFV